MNTDPIDVVLDELPDARSAGRGWKARCPAHDDRTPSLSVSETDDGTVLIKCWAGCTTGDVLDALDLDFSDLFPATRLGGRR